MKPNLVIHRHIGGVLLGALALGLSILTACADYPSSVLSDGPVAYYRFSETVATVPDLATNRGTVGATDNGIYIGSVVQGTNGALVGSADKAAGFDGSGARVAVGYDPSLTVPGPFSVEAWVNPAVSPPPAGQSGLAAVLSCGHLATDPNRSGWLIYQAAGGWNLRMYNGSGSGTGVNITGGPAPVAGTWYHLAAVYDGTNAYVFVNGVQTASAPVTGFAGDSDGPFTIGTRSDVAFNYSGLVDEAALYTNALSAATILAHYQNGTNSVPSQTYPSLVLASSPIGYYRLDEQAPVPPVAPNSGTLGVAANGAYEYPAASVAGPQPPGYPAFAPTNNALGLDGTNAYVRIPQSGALTNASLKNVTEATFLCWVNPNAPQGGYKGLLAMRPLSTGLYSQTDDTLNYGWLDNGNTWGFNSGLIPPVGQWALAAVVVQPTQAVFYLAYTNGAGYQFQTATNLVSHPAADFTTGPFAVGQDIGVGGRFYNGSIDEVAVFTRALTQGRIRTYFLTAINDPNPPVLVSDPPTVSPAGIIYSTTPFSITADAYASSPGYQWFKDGNPLTGATNATFSKANAVVGDSGNYLVVVSNSFGSVTNSPVAISVNPAVPPTISQPPASRSVYVGGSAPFSVAATGTTPFSYQWQHAGTNLPGATNGTLIVSGVNAGNTGNYDVIVANVAGSVTSSTATLGLLTVTPGSYVEAVVTNGPIDYWRLDEAPGTTNAYDSMGNLDGIYTNGVTLGGPAGPPFGGSDTSVNFDGSTGVILLNGSAIPAPWTAIFWARRTDPFQPSAALIDDRINPVSASLRLEQWQNTGKVGISRYNGFGDIAYGYGAPSGEWVQLVFVGKTNSTDLYVNGVLTDSSPNSMPLPRRKIGASETTDWLKGDLDEISLYGYNLSASTINAIYSAGAYGTTTPPQILNQPVSRVNVVGTTATFTVNAGGSLPLGYQWNKNGTPISGATGTSLSISNVYFTDAGNYSVQITNNLGATNSVNAALTVMPPPTYANQTNGLVLHLTFDVDFKDSSGRTNDATPVNSPTLIPGKVGAHAVHLTNDAVTPIYVEVLNTNTTTPYPDLQFDAATSFTIAYWARYTGSPNDLPIIGNAINSTYQPGFVFTDDGGKLDWTIVSVAPDTGSVIADPVPGSPLINDGTWHHALVSFDRAAGTASSYVDGVLVDTRSIAGIGNLDTGNGIFLGQDPSGFYGVIAAYDVDDVGIWRRALNNYEALSIYNAAQNSKESFDVYGPVKVTAGMVGSNFDVSWQAGTLLQAAKVTGPYTPVPGAVAPFYRTTATGTARFFRVLQ